jgi:hypothetical protein
MSLRIISTAFTLGGLTLLGLSAYSYLAASTGPQVIVLQTDLELDDFPVGQQAVVVPVHNHSRRPIRVLGWSEC